MFSKDLFDNEYEVILLKRFSHKSPCPEPGQMILVEFRGDDDNREMLVQLTDKLKQGFAPHCTQGEVEKDQVRGLLLDSGDRLGPDSGRDDLVALSSEGIGDSSQEIWIVIDDENCPVFFHGFPQPKKLDTNSTRRPRRGMRRFDIPPSSGSA